MCQLVAYLVYTLFVGALLLHVHTNLGQYLYSLLENHPEFEIAFVWNRTKHVLIDCHVAPSLILDKLENIFELEVDLIVEVAHPNITKKVWHQ